MSVTLDVDAPDAPVVAWSVRPRRRMASNTPRCKFPKRYHPKSGQCRTPCTKSHGKGFRRSSKGPHFPCVKTKTKRPTATKRAKSVKSSIMPFVDDID